MMLFLDRSVSGESKGSPVRFGVTSMLVAALADRIPVLMQKYGKSFPDLTPGLIQKLNRFDPTGDRALYTEWLVRQERDGADEEFYHHVRPILSQYDRLKSTKEFRQSGLSPDINRYSWSQVLDADFYIGLLKIERFTDESNAVSKNRRGQQKARLVYQEGSWSIYRISTLDMSAQEAIEALCDLSAGRGWCTKKESSAREYIQNGPIYVVMESNVPKALYSPETKEFHDPQNNSLPKNSPIWKLWGRYGRSYATPKRTNVASVITGSIVAALADRIPVLLQKYGKKIPGLNADLIRRINRADR